MNINKVFRGRIEINQSGIINKIGEPTGDADFIFKDELIFPGFVDLHVHAREDMSHTQDYKEDFVSAGEAAINGGVIAFAEMPNNPMPPIDDASYDAKLNLAKKSPVDILLYGGIGKGTKPLARLVPYKVFMGPSVGDLFFAGREELEQTISRYAGLDISFHCEEPEILEKNKNASTHEARRPKEAEISAVEFALYLIEKYNLIGKICHCSTMESIAKIIKAKERELPVSVEVTPHHLYFDETMIEDNRKTFQVNPPIRQSKKNRLALILALKNGDIDYLATDHAPHTIAEKEKGTSGLTHLDTYGPFTAWLAKEHNFTPGEIARVCSINPANFLNKFLTESYGEIKEGYAGSLTIIDMNKPVMITKDILKTKCGWSPFEGVTFPGSVAMTIVKGIPYQSKLGTGQEIYEK
ncbi:MAG: dihydroorotase [Parcubacteria group bacterium Gr01-1014_24]|nr:MAG: dihydroorotase [Parcubacteria group bacterium Gr01-1014_24]